MTQFDQNADGLIIRFTDEEGEEIVWEIDALPLANPIAETYEDSVNSEEYFYDDDKYKAIVYVSLTDGNIELFNNETYEEITDFEVEKTYMSENMNQAPDELEESCLEERSFL